MYRISRMSAVVTMIAVVFHCSLPTLAAPEATIEGTVEVPCDPSRIGEVASVQIRPVSGGSTTTVAVDSSTGAFVSPGLAEGEYELIAIGADGKRLSPEPKRLSVHDGLNSVVLSMQPSGCGEQEKTPGAKGGLKQWQVTLIYLGVIGAVVFALNDDEDPASPF